MIPTSDNTARRRSFHRVGNWSFRTQMLLIFILCLAICGIGMVFLNAYVIGHLKDEMRQKALLLAEELGQKTTENIQGLFDKKGNETLQTLRSDKRLAQQLELTLKANNSVIAACIVDSQGNVVIESFGNNKMAYKLHDGEKELNAEINTPDPSNFTALGIRLRQIDPTLELKPVEVPIMKNEARMGRLRLLISQSDIYNDIEAAARQINRLLWSAQFAFVGVLALALYLMARLFRRQMHLLEENEKLDRMAYVGTLASGLAHEIRNPLNAMSMNVSIAEEEVAADGNGSNSETANRALGMLRREIGRLNRSVTSFMEFAHPAVDRREKTRLRPLIDEVVDLLKPQVEETGTQVEIDISDDTELLADFSGLRQVIYNVVLNAIQAMSENRKDGGVNRLIIGGRRESAQWLLWIEDNGPGVSAGDEERIFEVFHSTKAAGSGFGLSIARAVIASHDGEIRAMRGENGGLRIEITLPDVAAPVRYRFIH